MASFSCSRNSLVSVAAASLIAPAALGSMACWGDGRVKLGRVVGAGLAAGAGFAGALAGAFCLLAGASAAWRGAARGERAVMRRIGFFIVCVEWRIHSPPRFVIVAGGL